MIRRLGALALLGTFLAPGVTADSGPCANAEHRQFDFWVGDWRVTAPDGSVAGSNRIEKILGGCVLHESWQGAQGSRGQSFNMYFERDGRWHQNWVDAQGGRLDLSGALRDGSMVLEGEMPGREGGTVLHRVRWEPLADGRVRQHWQASRDGGTTWDDVFVGFYERRGPREERGDQDTAGGTETDG